MESGAASARLRPRPARRSVHPGSPGGAVRARRIAIVAALVALVPALFSYLGAVMGTSNAPLGIRTVEWLRDHGAAGIVAEVESVYYSLTAPSKGGPGLKSVPHVGYASAAALAAKAAAEYRPPRVQPLLTPVLPGEGEWHATRPGLEREPPVLVTTLRDQTEYPRVLAGVAWIDLKRASISYVPGRLEPATEMPRGSAEVPPSARGTLLATFNSGFKLADSGGGVVAGGHTYAPMRNGMATIVGYSDGHVDVIDWHYGRVAPAGVVFARQNLPLLVDEGRKSANIENTAEWGATVGNAVLVWRSAVGVDAHGNLIYVAGPDQSVSSIAEAMIHAGAVRAMELDINSFWTSFITYGAPGALQPKNLLPNMERGDTRYLEPDDRDFFAVYSR
jgi:Phosphodiester glycosidase